MMTLPHADPERCTGCAVCRDMCPNDAIEMVKPLEYITEKFSKWDKVVEALSNLNTIYYSKTGAETAYALEQLMKAYDDWLD